MKSSEDWKKDPENPNKLLVEHAMFDYNIGKNGKVNLVMEEMNYTNYKNGKNAHNLAKYIE
jgi:hypothetical protein